MTAYTMTKASSRWHSDCAVCGGRIRLGRRYIVDPEDSTKTLHEQCFEQRARKLNHNTMRK